MGLGSFRISRGRRWWLGARRSEIGFVWWSVQAVAFCSGWTLKMGSFRILGFDAGCTFFAARRCMRCAWVSMAGPWERAPSARADSSLRSSDIVLDYMVERGCTGNVVKRFVLIVKLLVTGFLEAAGLDEVGRPSAGNGEL